MPAVLFAAFAWGLHRCAYTSAQAPVDPTVAVEPAFVGREQNDALIDQEPPNLEEIVGMLCRDASRYPQQFCCSLRDREAVLCR
jgi:hypothetical protein